MIRISFSVIIGSYILFWLVIFFTAWFCQKLPNSLGSLRLSNKVIRRCSVCTYTYFLSYDSVITRCPLCGSLNKKSESGPQEGELLL